MEAQARLASLAEPVTHRSIARELGLGDKGYASVAKQRRRIFDKLERLRASDVSP